MLFGVVPFGAAAMLRSEDIHIYWIVLGDTDYSDLLRQLLCTNVYSMAFLSLGKNRNGMDMSAYSS